MISTWRYICLVASVAGGFAATSIADDAAREKPKGRSANGIVIPDDARVAIFTVW